MTFIYNTPIFNINPVHFRAKNPRITPSILPKNDLFVSNPLIDKFSNEANIMTIIKSNPNIQSLLKENKIPLKINMQELYKLQKGHLKETRVIASKIYSALPKELKSNVNSVDLQEASMLHDYGKILIPEKILNKTGKLTLEEKQIMDLHSDFGYELLKNQNINDNVLNMVKYHHQTPKGNGYPTIKDNFDFDISSQILSCADKYTALTEDRSYKKAMSRLDALKILHQDVDNGNLSNDIFEALKQVTK